MPYDSSPEWNERRLQKLRFRGVHLIVKLQTEREVSKKIGLQGRLPYEESCEFKESCLHKSRFRAPHLIKRVAN